MTPYAGSPDSFPITVQIPDDADPPSASVFDVGYEGCLDRTAALANGYQTEYADIPTLKAVNTTSLIDGAIRRVAGLGRYRLDKTVNPTFAEDLNACVAPTTGTGRWFALDIAKINYRKTFTALSTSWTAPPNIAVFRVIMCGGGGGGGGGANAGFSTSDASGGGGGKGAPLVTIDWTTVTPGHTYTMSAGPGGAGGAAATAGSDGANSGIVDPVGPVTVAQALGGQGGSGGTLADVGGAQAVFTPGGTGLFGARKTTSFIASIGGAWPLHQREADGGYSTNSQLSGLGASPGVSSSQGGGGGSAGATGASPGGRIGGGGGGGGGGGPIGGAGGGSGGAGGSGNNTGAGVAGSNGSSPALANNGAGGGGGGGGGAGTSGSASGGAGASGSSGFVTIVAIS